MPGTPIVVDPADIVLSQGGLLIVDSTTGSGTGNYDSFLRIQANGGETGYNTNTDGQLENKDGIWTHSLLISSLNVVTAGGVDYYEVRLDLNEVQSGDNANITLDDLQLWVGPAALGGAYPTFAGLTQKFDLSGTLGLVDNENGSGTDDYQILIPVSMLTGGDYLTLYADFSGSSDGFEEFRAQTSVFTPQPDIGVLKVTEGVDDDCQNLIVGGTVHWTYTVENNGNIPLTDVVVTDNAGTVGDTSDDFTATYVSGDTNGNDILDLTETWTFSASGTVIEGHYDNLATVTANYSYDDGEGGTVTGSVNGEEEDCYIGVTPAIQIVKSANGYDTDCKNILAGEDVVFTYAVTNTSDEGITIDNVTVVDDNATAGSGDDFSPDAVLQLGETHNVGDLDDDDILDVGETWQYTFTGAALAGEHENTATVNGTAHDAANNTAPVTDDDDACYFGADPSISIIKKTNGTDDLCPVVSVGDAVTWTYFVENTGNVALSITDLHDDNGTGLLGEDGDDFIPTAVLQLGETHNAGDLNDNDIFDAGEIWQYSATGTVLEGHYDNVAYVSGAYTDDFEHSTTVSANEDDCYVGVEGPGVRTPGFWSNPRNGGEFWNGSFNDEKHAGEDCFPLTELTRTDTNGNGQLDSGDAENSIMQSGKKGLLIGDWNMDGIENNGEDTLFVSLEAANILINASQKDQQDGRYVVGRDLVASWLNYLAGNPVGGLPDSGGAYTPADAMQDAINFLQQYGDTADNGIFKSGNSIGWEGSAVKQGKPGSGWDVGSLIHGALDGYNNTGMIDGIGYAHSCDTDQFVSMMTAFSTDHGLFSM